jgi:hypothetical protein
MSHYLRVLCRSAHPLTRKEIGEFIREGYFFKGPPRFEPDLDHPFATHADWARFEIHPPDATHPVILHRATPSVLASSVDEIIQTLRDAALESSHSALIQRIRDSQQLITLEFEPTRMTEETWEMLDTTEAHVARACDGVVFAPGEGVYDSALQPLWTFTPPGAP